MNWRDQSEMGLIPAQPLKGNDSDVVVAETLKLLEERTDPGVIVRWQSGPNPHPRFVVVKPDFADDRYVVQGRVKSQKIIEIPHDELLSNLVEIAEEEVYPPSA